MASKAESADVVVPASSSTGYRTRRMVTIWIALCALLVLAMVVVGGITRLTRSGLSIVDWRPVTGALPPLGVEAWQAEFARYQSSPEFRLVNRDMTLAGFRSIFLVEWFHRLLGRLVGVVVLPPLAFFAHTRALTRQRIAQVGAMFALGGLQGALGWFMVKSGLVDVPRVSPYRLTAHLLLALAIFCGLLWAALDEARGERGREISVAPAAWTLARALVPLATLTIAWGGFMAGLHAGHVAPSFPTMNGAWVPGGMGALRPAWSNLFENPVAVHFTHRALAYATAMVAVAASLCTLLRPAPRAARALAAGLLAAVALQITLGALTVLAHVPVGLASWHQGNGALLLGISVALLHAMRSAYARRIER